MKQILLLRILAGGAALTLCVYLARRPEVHPPPASLATSVRHTAPSAPPHAVPMAIEAEKNSSLQIPAGASREELERLARNAAATSPESAIALARELLKNDPDAGEIFATALEDALSANKEFSTALSLVPDLPADAQLNSINTIFSRWGKSSPEDAMQNLGAVADEKMRDAAFRSAVNSWSEDGYPALAKYALSMPAGDNRDYAMARAIDNWSLQDPAGLGTWLNRLPRGAEFDYGATLIILKTDAANRSREVAMQWAQNISDPQLRQAALEHLAAENAPPVMEGDD